ncbi:MAG: CorA family divalent cation transporter [Saprospiraceae bacterium]
MIELYLKSNEVKVIDNVSDIKYAEDNLFNIRVIDFSEETLKNLSSAFNLDTTIFNQREDIEISSHYLKNKDQISFNFSIPAYEVNSLFTEDEIFIIIKNEVVYYFLSKDIDENFINITKSSYDFSGKNFKSHLDHFVFQIAVISDYYADLTEIISRRIKQFYKRILTTDKFLETDLDLIARLNFNNLLIKESLTNFQRILHLLIRNKFEGETIREKINLELDDIDVISDHIQFNFERLDDLKENITAKIDLEQNKIFRILTVITVCISLPTLIAGIYGMNFKHMPELDSPNGYFYALGMMGISFTGALVYFWIKRWVR